MMPSAALHRGRGVQPLPAAATARGGQTPAAPGQVGSSCPGTLPGGENAGKFSSAFRALQSFGGFANWELRLDPL